MKAKAQFTEADYLRWRDLVARQFGLEFSPKKRRDLERAVLQALADCSLPSLADYYACIKAAAGRRTPEVDRLISLLTVGETYFFRDDSQFQLLRDRILAELIKGRQNTEPKLRIWSAGCATGEEPYSVAMMLRELIRPIDSWKIEILATDVNTDALQKARAGRYTSWSFRTMPQYYLDKYFAKSGDVHEIDKQIRDMVTFRELNLNDSLAYPSIITRTVDYDLIICRNVTIYFSAQTTQQIIDRFCDCLNDGGWLLMGASDPSAANKMLVCRNFDGTFIYQKGDRRGAQAPPKATADAQSAGQRGHGGDNRVIARSGPQAPRRGNPHPTEHHEPVAAPPPPPTDPLKEIGKLIDTGRLDEALAQLRQLDISDGQGATVYYLMGKIEANRGRLAQAKDYAEQALQRDKLMVEGHFLLSLIHQGLGDDIRAIESAKKAIYLKPKFVEAYFCLACLYRKRGQIDLAKRAFRNVVRLASGMPKDRPAFESDGLTFGRLTEIAGRNVVEGER